MNFSNSALCEGRPKSAANAISIMLDLSDRDLCLLPPEVFASGELRELNLYRNSLEEVSSALCSLTNLEVLILADNGLRRLPANFGQLGKLRMLDLGHNLLSELPESFSGIANISDYLYLHDNRIERLRDELFRGFTRLRYLNLSQNPLITLPSSIAEMSGLEELRLEEVGLTQVPEWLGSLPRLDELSFRNNRLRTLPDDLGSLKELTRLDLRGNQLESLPTSVLALPRLRKLDLRWNPPLTGLDVAALKARGCRVLI